MSCPTNRNHPAPFLEDEEPENEFFEEAQGVAEAGSDDDWEPRSRACDYKFWDEETEDCEAETKENTCLRKARQTRQRANVKGSLPKTYIVKRIKKQEGRPKSATARTRTVPCTTYELKNTEARPCTAPQKTSVCLPSALQNNGACSYSAFLRGGADICKLTSPHISDANACTALKIGSAGQYSKLPRTGTKTVTPSRIVSPSKRHASSHASKIVYTLGNAVTRNSDSSSAKSVTRNSELHSTDSSSAKSLGTVNKGPKIVKPVQRRTGDNIVKPGYNVQGLPVKPTTCPNSDRKVNQSGSRATGSSVSGENGCPSEGEVDREAEQGGKNSFSGEPRNGISGKYRTHGEAASFLSHRESRGRGSAHVGKARPGQGGSVGLNLCPAGVEVETGNGAKSIRTTTGAKIIKVVKSGGALKAERERRGGC